MNKKSIGGILLSILIEVIVIAVFVLVVWKAGKWSYDFGYQVFAEMTVDEEPGRDIQITINEGDSNKAICNMLEEKGLIYDANPFFVRLMITDYRSLLKPGTYTLNTSMLKEEMMAVMSGETLEEE